MRDLVKLTVLAVAFAAAAIAVPPAGADDLPNGIYGWCYRYVNETREDADTSTVYCKRIGGSTVSYVTGYEYPYLFYHVARFSYDAPPGQYIPAGENYWYKLMARKTYGTIFWESEWTDSMNYDYCSRYDRDLILENTGAGGK